MKSSLTKYGIEKRFSRTTFESIQRLGIDKELEDNFKKCKYYADNFQDFLDKGQGLTLMGDYGTRKTTLAVAIMRVLIDKGYNVLFVPMCSLMDSLYSLGKLNALECAEYERQIRTKTLLVIDDLGSENTSVEWIRAKIDSIVTERHSKMLPTIITTNLSLDELGESYNGRIVDRMKSTNYTLTFMGGSNRRELGDLVI